MKNILEDLLYRGLIEQFSDEAKIKEMVLARAEDLLLFSGGS